MLTLPESVLMRNLAGSSGFLGSAGWGSMATTTLPEVVDSDSKSRRGYLPLIVLGPFSMLTFRLLSAMCMNSLCGW